MEFGAWSLEFGVISCLLDYLLNSNNPTPPKLCFAFPPRCFGEGIKGWGAMTVGIATNYADFILLNYNSQD
ncbi:hypothetical protein GXM_01293 [Nostoc sphaeroides CCNUC1]|uniref:Uncharacterized protein n=1 Tax=Nostoc sphaeroides CCNUC1 TaxID=2653204 RepID=A0A5P8VTV9_9NOSO|nr:hypothetical protein GXM_01293 [Nostoc sphaeroides CCNUC1]